MNTHGPPFKPEIDPIRQDPVIAFQGEGFKDFPNARVDQIVVGTGRIAVNLNAVQTDQIYTRAGLLTSVGVPRKGAAPRLYIGEDGFKNRLRRLYNELEIDGQANISRRFFELGVFTLLAANRPLRMNPVQQDVANRISLGQTVPEVSKEYTRQRGREYCEATVRGHLQSISQKNGWQGGPEITLAALASGQVGNFVPLE